MRSLVDEQTERAVAAILDGVLSSEEQRQMSRYASRLLTAIDEAEGE